MQAASQALHNIRARFQQAWRSEPSGRMLAHGLAYEVDGLLHAIWRQKASPAAEVCDLVAVGGYGRGELCLYSDWDLWLVPTGALARRQEEALERFVQALWDTGAKIGVRFGAPEELAQAFAEDHHAATAALDARLVAGGGRGFAALCRLRDRWLDEHAGELVRAKIDELKARWQAAQNTAFAMEPNVKNARGGLRDVQAAGWLAELLPRAMRRPPRLFPREFDELREAESFLWRMRFALHALNQRADDRLVFERQYEIAQALFPQAEEAPVVAFMRAYFRRAGRIARIVSLFVEDIEEALAKPRTRARRLGAWRLVGGKLAAPHPYAFREDPRRIVALFAEAAAHRLAIHGETLRRVREDAMLIGEDLRTDPRITEAFLRILRKPSAAPNVLWAMHTTGVLARIIPEFRPAVGYGQFNRYHAYTVDEHALRALDEAASMLAGRPAAPARFVPEAAAGVHRPDVLLLSALLHDVGKAHPGEDHSEVGARIAKRAAERLGLHADSQALLAWLVRHHLALSQFAERADTADPEAVAGLASLVGDPGRLSYLYLLTIADIRAVSEQAWTPWKAALLDEAYEAVRAQLEARPDAWQARLALRRRTSKALSGLDDAAADRALAMFAPETMLRLAPRWLAHALRLVASGRDEALDVIADAAHDETVAYLLAEDRPGLFAQAAEGIARAGEGIAAAYAERLVDGRALDVFVLQRNAASRAECARIVRAMREALASERPLPLPRTRPDWLMRRTEVRVHVRWRKGRTIWLEVQAADQLGLLARLARTISDAGWGIRQARAWTYGERVLDGFAVAPERPDHLEEEALIEQVRKAARIGGSA